MRKQLTKKQRINKLRQQRLYQKYLLVFIAVGLVFFVVYRGSILLSSFGESPLTKFRVAQAQGIDIRDYACNSLEEESPTGSDNSYFMPSAKVTEKYAKNIVSGNQVVNTGLNLESGSTEPVGYTKNVDSSPNWKLERIQDDGGFAFLRSSILNPVEDKVAVAWLMQPVNMKATSYHYSFEYRSNTKTRVEVIATNNSGQEQSFLVGDLVQNGDWQKIEGHFANYDGEYISIRVVARPVEVGFTDTRNYNVDELRDIRPETGMVSISFDDGWESIYTSGLPLFEKYKIPTTQFVISSFARKRVDQYMTTEQIQKMQKKGHEISSHSLRHCDLKSLNAEDLAYDLTTSKSLLQAKKIGTDNIGVAFPYGSYSAAVNTESQKYFNYARTSDVGYNDGYVDPYLIKIQSVEADTTIEEMKAWLDYAKKNRLWVVFVYHQVGESGDYSVDKANLEQQLEAVAGSGLDVKTIKDSLARF